MPKIDIYSTLFCPYCTRAKMLLQEKGVEFHEIRVDLDSGLRREMMELSGRTSAPQIFIDGEHIGGCDDLYHLDAQGGLDVKLGLTKAS